jgi:hypothetical protein
MNLLNQIKSDIGSVENKKIRGIIEIKRKKHHKDAGERVNDKR